MFWHWSMTQISKVCLISFTLVQSSLFFTLVWKVEEIDFAPFFEDGTKIEKIPSEIKPPLSAPIFLYMHWFDRIFLHIEQSLSKIKRLLVGCCFENWYYLLSHRWQLELSLNVEKNICLRLLDHFRVCNRNCGVVEMIPLAVFGSKSCIMTRSSPRNKLKNKC